MAANARFAIAVHTLGMLAFADRMPVSSERIAESVGTNPVTIRRIVQALTRAGLVEGRMGPSGGARLTRPPGEITLRDVYRAVDEGEVFALPRSGGNACCGMSQAVRPVLEEIFAEAAAALEDSLGRLTVAAVIGRVQERRACG